nr:reverse transcriptase domain-containing protein [Tanacetum cinerariifolium]
MHADLLPPLKRIRDSDSMMNFNVCLEDGYEPYIPREIGLGVDIKDSYEPYTVPDVQADIDECFTYADAIRARGMNVRVIVETSAEEEVESSARGTIEVEVDPRVRPFIDDDVCESVREDVPDHVTADGAIKVTYETLGDLVQRFDDHTIKILNHQIQVIESVRETRDIELWRLANRALLYLIVNIIVVMKNYADCYTSRMTQDAINKLVAKHMEEALKAYNAARNFRTEIDMKDDQQDDHVEANVNNVNDNGNGNRNPNVNNRGVVPVARVYTYQNFVKCQPLNFKGTKGVVGLTRWFKKMETAFHISNCPPRYQVKYASCTLLDGALTWWNSYKRTVGVDADYAMT